MKLSTILKKEGMFGPDMWNPQKASDEAAMIRKMIRALRDSIENSHMASEPDGIPVEVQENLNQLSSAYSDMLAAVVSLQRNIR